MASVNDVHYSKMFTAFLSTQGHGEICVYPNGTVLKRLPLWIQN